MNDIILTRPMPIGTLQLVLSPGYAAVWFHSSGGELWFERVPSDLFSTLSRICSNHHPLRQQIDSRPAL